MHQPRALAPLSVIAADDTTELAHTLAGMRRAALLGIAEHSGRLADRQASFDQHVADFLDQLGRAPGEALARYGQTVARLHRQRRQFDEQHVFLTGPGGGRILVGGVPHSRSALSRRLIRQRDPGFLDQNPQTSHHTLIEHAVRLVEGSLAAIDHNFATVESARAALVESARSLLRELGSLQRFGLLPPRLAPVADLKNFLSVCFGELDQQVSKESRAKALLLLRGASLRQSFRMLADQVARVLAKGIAESLPREKRALRRPSAREQAALLDAWCDERTNAARPTDPVTRAILGLHFSFSSFREGLGGLVPAARARYEETIGKASAGEVRRAVRSLTEAGMLGRSDLDLFRYNRPVWSAVQASTTARADGSIDDAAGNL